MTDIELLELAALAAGIDAPDFTHENGTWVYKEPNKKNWNPLADDGDALRLAVKLGLDVSFYESAMCVYAGESMEPFTRTPDRYAATRRAIVRAAAEIGKSMSGQSNHPAKVA